MGHTLQHKTLILDPSVLLQTETRHKLGGKRELKIKWKNGKWKMENRKWKMENGKMEKWKNG